MKQLFFVGLLTLLASHLCHAQESASQLIEKMEQRIEAMGNYRVEFTADMADIHIESCYLVAGDSYFISLGSSEAYCDGRVRYEVNHTHREVVLDNHYPASSDLMMNPTRVFLILDEQFDASYRDSEGSIACIDLVPKRSKKQQLATIRLYIDTATSLPIGLLYDPEGEELDIRIKQIRSTDEPMPRFDEERYPDYELIDFR